MPKISGPSGILVEQRTDPRFDRYLRAGHSLIEEAACARIPPPAVKPTRFGANRCACETDRPFRMGEEGTDIIDHLEIAVGISVDQAVLECHTPSLAKRVDLLPSVAGAVRQVLVCEQQE